VCKSVPIRHASTRCEGMEVKDEGGEGEMGLRYGGT